MVPWKEVIMNVIRNTAVWCGHAVVGPVPAEIRWYHLVPTYLPRLQEVIPHLACIMIKLASLHGCGPGVDTNASTPLETIYIDTTQYTYTRVWTVVITSTSVWVELKLFLWWLNEQVLYLFFISALIHTKLLPRKVLVVWLSEWILSFLFEGI